MENGINAKPTKNLKRKISRLRGYLFMLLLLLFLSACSNNAEIEPTLVADDEPAFLGTWYFDSGDTLSVFHQAREIEFLQFYLASC